MASKTEKRAFDAIDALNKLAQKGDEDAVLAIRRVVDHALARQEQAEAVLAAAKAATSANEVEL